MSERHAESSRPRIHTRRRGASPSPLAAAAVVKRRPAASVSAGAKADTVPVPAGHHPRATVGAGPLDAPRTSRPRQLPAESRREAQLTGVSAMSAPRPLPANRAVPWLSATQAVGAAAAQFASPTLTNLSATARRSGAQVHLPDAIDRATALSANNGEEESAGGQARVDAPPLVSSTAAAAAWAQPPVAPREASVFYPQGQAAQPPLLLHYVQLGHWRTVAAGRDYFNHRRLTDREVTGHTVRWLHNARPRDRLVFLVEPVEERPTQEPASDVGMETELLAREETRRATAALSTWARIQRKLFGPAPAFAYNRGKLAKEASWWSQHVESGHGATTPAEDVDEQGGDKGYGATGGFTPFVSPVASPVGTGSQVFGALTATSTASSTSPVLAATTTCATPYIDPLRLPSRSALSRTAVPYTPRRSAEIGKASGGLSATAAAAGVPLSQARKNKAIRRMLVAQLFGRDGPVADGETRCHTDSFAASTHEPPSSSQSSSRASSIMSSPVARQGRASRLDSQPRFSASVPDRVLFSSRPTSPVCDDGARSRQGPCPVSRVDRAPVSSLHAPTMESDQRPRAHSQPASQSHSRSETCEEATLSEAAASVTSRGSAVLTFAKQHISLLSSGSFARRTGATSAPLPASVSPSSRPAPPRGPRRGVEVIEVAHADITALDYAPRLLSSRFSIEAKEVNTYFFTSTAAACAYYGCPEAVEQIQGQLRQAVSAHIPVATASGEMGRTVRARRTSAYPVATTTPSTTTTADHAAPRPVLPSLSPVAQSLVLPAATTQEWAHGRTDSATSLMPSSGEDESVARRPEVDTDDDEELLSIAAALKKGVLPPSRTRRGDCQAGAPACASGLRREPSEPALGEAGQPLLRRSPTLPSVSRMVPPRDDNPPEADAVRGVHTPLRPTRTGKGSSASSRSPSIAPVKGTCPPPSMYRSATKVFNEHKPRPAVERAEVEQAARLAALDVSVEVGLRSRQHTPLPPAELNREAVRGGATPVPTSADRLSSVAHVDWRTLDVDAAPLPCLVPKEAVLRVRMSTHMDVVVSVYTADPHFNAALREVLMPESGTHPYTASPQEQQRLLSMYEAGMPAWTVFMGSVSLIRYRRVYRVVYIALTNLWPLVSLGAGVYDLYRHLDTMKRFMSHTIEPLVRRIEAHFSLRVSVWGTYLFSVLFTIFSNLSVFLSQFYVVQILSPVVRLAVMAVKLPCVALLASVWSALSIVASFIGLIWMTAKVLVLGPFLFVLHLAGWFGATTSSTTTSVVRGTSLTMRWWRAWQEFWLTVASPIKNLAKAWWDSMLHVAVSITRREATLRRWYTARMTQLLGALATLLEHTLIALEGTADVITTNTRMWSDERWLLSRHPPAMSQWVYLVLVLVVFASLVRTLVSEHHAWKVQSSRGGHPSARAPLDSGLVELTREASPYAVAVPPPPFPLPVVFGWVWYHTLRLVRLCVVALTRRHGRACPPVLCQRGGVAQYLFCAASPPCDIAVMAVATPSVCGGEGCDGDVPCSSDEVFQYQLPFDRYPPLERTAEAAYIRDVLRLRVPGTTRVEYRMHLHDD